MAFKIKDNLDLYGNQLLNFALQSDSGFPQSPQVGHMFNYTGTGVMANHAVMCVDETTKAFKALAFVDEIATNAEFVELKEKVDLLIGEDVDTDTIIDSWKEVQAFLADIEDTKTLQGMLSSYLPKSGGKISSTGKNPLEIDSTYKGETQAIRVSNNGVIKCTLGWFESIGAYFTNVSKSAYLAIKDDGTPTYNNNTLIHSGNYATEIGDYYLKSQGGTIDGNLDIGKNNANYTTQRYLRMWYGDGAKAYRGMLRVNAQNIQLSYYIPSSGVNYSLSFGVDGLKYNDAGAERTLIHSGNYSDYALPLSGGTISASAAAPLTIDTTYSYIEFPLKVKGDIKVNIGWNGGDGMYLQDIVSGLYLGIKTDGTPYYYDKTEYRTLLHSGNIGDQNVKGLIGTDGIVTATSGTSGRLSLNGRIYWNGDADWFSIGSYTETSGVPPFGRYIFYSGHIFKTAAGESMRINSSGNVTIGADDAAGSDARFYVNNNVTGSTALGLHVTGPSLNSHALGKRDGWAACIGRPTYGLLIGSNTTNGTSLLQVGRLDKEEARQMALQPLGGNVGIGTADPKKKLHVVGDLYVDGNIIATKEVSAGGAGQEGESGDGGAEVISQPLAKGQSTYTITNTIKRSDIAVSLYEETVINSQTIWSLCLADIEVTNTTITVTFGSATSVNHKLVAVG